MPFSELCSTYRTLPSLFHSLCQDDEAKKTSKDTSKKGPSDAKKTTNKEREEEEETKMEDEQEQGEHLAENREEAESHAEGEEALSADVLDNQSLKDIVRANMFFSLTHFYYINLISFAQAVCFPDHELNS